MHTGLNTTIDAFIRLLFIFQSNGHNFLRFNSFSVCSALSHFYVSFWFYFCPNQQGRTTREWFIHLNHHQQLGFTMRVSLPSMRACGKRDACADTPDTVTAETFAEESEMFDIDMMPSIWLSPDRSRAGCVSPLSCFMGGGGGDIAWCSPSRVLVTTDTLAKEIDHNDDAELALNSMTATPLDFSFDSAHGIEMYSRDSAENPTEGRAAFVSATAFDCGRNPRGVGLSVGCFQGRQNHPFGLAMS